MRCPSCETVEDKVVDSRLVEQGVAIRRRRECLECGFRFTTYERTLAVSLRVMKRSGDAELFDRAKVTEGIRRACKNRPVEDERIERAATEIEEMFRSQGMPDVTSQDVGMAVLERLAELDEVAYVRFASVYRDFQGLSDFEREVGQLLEKKTPPKPAGRAGRENDARPK